MHGRGAVEHAPLGSSHETGVNDYKDVAAVRMSNLLSVLLTFIFLFSRAEIRPSGTPPGSCA